MQPLYTSDTLRAVLNRGAPAGAAGAPALVTFEGRGVERRQASGDIFAEALAAKLGIDIVHIIPRAADWYHYPDIGACLDAVRPHLDAATLAYGSSMGAYAVARFADRLGVARGLCLSPQYSINPRIVPFESRWQDFARRIAFQHDDSIAPRAARLWIFTDLGFEPERRHAELIAASGPTEIIDVPDAGHPAGPALVEARLLQPITDAFLQGRESRAGFERLIAERLDRSPTVLMRRLHRTRGPERRALLERALALPDLPPRMRLELGLVLLQTRRVAEAEALLAPLLAPPCNPRFVNRYRRICDKLGLAPRLAQ